LEKSFLDGLRNGKTKVGVLMSEKEKVESAVKYFGEKLREMSQKAFEDLENFWSEVADNLVWFKRWDKVLEWSPPFARWFVGGVLNACYNALDVNLKKGLKNKVAYFWEGEEGTTRTLTYYQLWKGGKQVRKCLEEARRQEGRPSINLPADDSRASDRHAGMRQNRRLT